MSNWTLGNVQEIITQHEMRGMIQVGVMVVHIDHAVVDDKFVLTTARRQHLTRDRLGSLSYRLLVMMMSPMIISPNLYLSIYI